MQNKKKHDSGEEMRCEVGREQAIPERWPCQQNFMPSQKTNRCAGMGQERQGWAVCPPQQCVEMEVCVLPCALRILAGFCYFSKNNFVGSGKKNEKTKHRLARRENVFFCWREPAGGVEIFDACLAGSAVGAGSCWNFSKSWGETCAKQKKMRKRENPPKEEKTEGEGGNEKHGKLVILVKCAHCARKSISPDRTAGNPFSYRK